MPADTKTLDDQALDTLFRAARTHKKWHAKDVPDALVRAVYDLAKMGPTSANICPARFIFITSDAAKEKLKPHLDKGNVEKTMTSPVVAIIAYDLKFYEHTGKLAPHAPEAVRKMFEGNPMGIQESAFRNGTLQGAYLMLAARALGLDCGPMSGFDKMGVKRAFFADKDWEANFLCNIGYGDPEGLLPRAPRFDFDEACEIL